MESSTAKKAIGEMLDPAIAELKVRTPSTEGKPPKPRRKTKEEKDKEATPLSAEDLAAKEVAKDIKM